MDEKLEYKQLIETNSDVLLKLIGDILDLSKIEAGSIDIKRQPFDLSDLCEELYQSFKQRIKNPDVSLSLINPYAKCTVNFDRQRLIQIFTNFATNAIKYTPKGEIVMGYECLPDKVRIYVKDCGIGISEEKKCRIFSRFEKLDNFAQGTGLGLSICKAIADATGSEIGFDSTEKEGSTFWYIGYTNTVIAEKPFSTETAVELAKREKATPHIPIEKLRILIAEDMESNFLLFKKILKNNHLTRVLTGAEAVEEVQVNTYDVILMDMKMPVMNGLEATALIRKFNPAIPIIALTANAFDSDKTDALTAGCNDFMTKPVNKQALSNLLAKFCSA